MGCFGSDTAKNEAHDEGIGRRKDVGLSDELSAECSEERFTTRLRSQVGQRKSTRSGVPGETVSRKDHTAPIESMVAQDGVGVIIIDMQSDEHLAQRRGGGTVGEYQLAVLGAAIEAKRPIIEITTGSKPTCKALLEVIDGYEHHVHVVKGQPNALDFATYDEDVARRLGAACRGISDMIVIGFDASICVQATIFGNHRPPLGSEDRDAIEEIQRHRDEETRVGGKYAKLLEEARDEEVLGIQRAYQEEAAEVRRVRKQCEDRHERYVPGILSWGIDVWTSPDVLVGALSDLYGRRVV
jgi:hypothetical protein